MQGTLLLIIAIAAITKIIRDTLKIHNLGTVQELGPVRGAEGGGDSVGGGTERGGAAKMESAGRRGAT